jgi:hypothetical protein
MGVLLMPHAETLQGTETKAAAATLVHTSIQTFSHLASGTLLQGWSGGLVGFRKGPKQVSGCFRQSPAYCCIDTCPTLLHVPSGHPKRNH